MNSINKIKKALKVSPGPKVTCNQDGLTTVYNNGFMPDAGFTTAEQEGAATGPISYYPFAGAYHVAGGCLIKKIAGKGWYVVPIRVICKSNLRIP